MEHFGRNDHVFTTGEIPQCATDDLFVVLPDGLQRIGEVAADLIRYTDARAGAQIPAVPAEVAGSVPVVTSLPARP